ncbi:hypothetical protein [Kordia sp.]|uniref:hypothetical protein n=1 Tax=Kordia sp. TaxID=1965332 RepID=UPI0025C716EB|nr:hypothetical protein [Kordia sp.]MCH2192756.1 hypothetical protein [Kordia sp.]
MEAQNDLPLDRVELSNEQLKGLPMFFKKIFYNQITNIEDELTLYKHNSRTQSSEMRQYHPSRIICKIENPKTTKEDEIYTK